MVYGIAILFWPLEFIQGALTMAYIRSTGGLATLESHSNEAMTHGNQNAVNPATWSFYKLR